MNARQALVLQLESVSYGIGGRTLLDGLDLTVRAGESVAISGPSGSGKSTLLTCVLGLLTPDAGRVVVAGEELSGMSGRRKSAHRRDKIGMVFQFGELLPELTALENVALAALLAGERRTDAETRAGELLEALGVPSSDVPTASLSGGERQRVAVGRALVNRPALLLADEPTGALDEDTRDEVAQLLFSVCERWECALVLATHDTSVAARASRRLALRKGKLVAAARPVREASK